jgi:uncharacterized protein YndB with AHSA1/START domain
MMSATTTTVDRATHTISFVRQFDAPPDAVFDAWTNPHKIAAWWDPTGAPLAACDVDLRPGGAFQFTMSSGHAPPFAGLYRTIDRPAELVFDALGAVGVVRLVEDQGGTRMTVDIRCTSSAHLEQFLALGIHTGTDVTLDNLVAFIRTH